MDCLEFEDRLDDFHAGTLSYEQRTAAEIHIRECPECRALWDAVSGKGEALAPEAGDELALAILLRTSGSACEEAELLLCDLTGGNLGGADQEIVRLHLAHCTGCRALASTLTELAQLLPGMAALDPGPRFTADVLEATLRLHNADQPVVRRRERALAWWNQLIRRPRFAWEAAYVGALIVLLALGNPAVWLRSLPQSFSRPQILVRGGDRILQEASAALAEAHAAADESLTTLQLQSRSTLGVVIDFTNRAPSAVREKAASWFNDLKLAFSEPAETDQQRNHH